MPTPLIAFRNAKLAQQVEARTQMYGDDEEATRQKDRLLSDIAERDLERYYEMIVRSTPKFSEGEAMLIADVLNGTIHMPYSVSLLWAEISDALQEGYAEKWGVDGPVLVERLRKLTVFECMAVADAIERAWNAGTYQVGDMSARLRQVGLVKSE